MRFEGLIKIDVGLEPAGRGNFFEGLIGCCDQVHGLIEPLLIVKLVHRHIETFAEPVPEFVLFAE